MIKEASLLVFQGKQELQADIKGDQGSIASHSITSHNIRRMPYSFDGAICLDQHRHHLRAPLVRGFGLVIAVHSFRTQQASRQHGRIESTPGKDMADEDLKQESALKPFAISLIIYRAIKNRTVH